jgi:hypothetical protein
VVVADLVRAHVSNLQEEEEHQLLLHILGVADAKKNEVRIAGAADFRGHLVEATVQRVCVMRMYSAACHLLERR